MSKEYGTYSYQVEKYKNDCGYWGNWWRAYDSLLQETPFEVRCSKEYKDNYTSLYKQAEKVQKYALSTDGNLNLLDRYYREQLGDTTAVLMFYVCDFSPIDLPTVNDLPHRELTKADYWHRGNRHAKEYNEYLSTLSKSREIKD